MYRDAVAAALADGRMERAERKVLDQVRDSLGLSAEEARRAEREALGP